MSPGSDSQLVEENNFKLERCYQFVKVKNFESACGTGVALIP